MPKFDKLDRDGASSVRFVESVQVYHVVCDVLKCARYEAIVYHGSINAVQPNSSNSKPRAGDAPPM